MAKSSFQFWVITGCAAMALILGAVFLHKIILTKDRSPTIYHHADGSFSLNSKTGLKVSPIDVENYLSQFEEMGRIRLVSGDTATLKDWKPMMEASASAGIAYYRMESSSGFWRFHFGYCQHSQEERLSTPGIIPKVIDLRDGKDAPFETATEHMHWNTEIWFNDTTRCETLIQALRQHSQPESIIVIKAGRFLLLSENVDDHGGDEVNGFKRYPPGFWQEYVRPILRKLKSF